MPNNKKLLFIIILVFLINLVSVYFVYSLTQKSLQDNRDPNRALSINDILDYMSERRELLKVRTEESYLSFNIEDEGKSLTNKQLEQVANYLKKHPIERSSRLVAESDIMQTLETLGYSDVIAAYRVLKDVSDEQVPFACYYPQETLYLDNKDERSVRYSLIIPNNLNQFIDSKNTGYDYVFSYVYCITSKTELLERNDTPSSEYSPGLSYLVIFNTNTQGPVKIENSGYSGVETGYIALYGGQIYSSTHSNPVPGIIRPLMVSKDGDVYYINESTSGGWGSITLYTFNIKTASPIKQVFECTGSIEKSGEPGARYGGNCFIYDRDNTLLVGDDRLTIE